LFPPFFEGTLDLPFDPEKEETMSEEGEKK
jgi:hypothetical protein